MNSKEFFENKEKLPERAPIDGRKKVSYVIDYCIGNDDAENLGWLVQENEGFMECDARRKAQRIYRTLNKNPRLGQPALLIREKTIDDINLYGEPSFFASRESEKYSECFESGVGYSREYLFQMIGKRKCLSNFDLRIMLLANLMNKIFENKFPDFFRECKRRNLSPITLNNLLYEEWLKSRV